MKRPILFLCCIALSTLLAACETTTSESPMGAGAAQAPAKKSNIRARPSGSEPSMADKTGGSMSTSGVRHIEDEDEDKTVLDTAQRMVQQGDFTSATVLYKRAAATNPQSTGALRGLAGLYEAQSKPRESLDAWRALVALNEDDADAHRGMGRAFLAMGLYDKAIESLKKSLALGGDGELKTVNLLAMAQLRGGAPDEAIETLKNALKNSDDLATRNNLGFAYVMAGETQLAIPLLEEVAKDPKSTAQQRQNLALAYGLAGRDSDARKVSLQDLPPAAVENNLKTYRVMRDKLAGRATPVVDAKPATKKKAAAKPKKAAVPAAAPAASIPTAQPATAPAAAPTTPVETAPAAPPSAAPVPATP